jgi:CRP/FNR family transcriptional regulator, cyclic AMP receptor protein
MGSLADIPLLRPLEPGLLRQLESRCGFVRYDANELIIDYDDLSDDVYFVLAGKVRILYRAGTGKEVILGELGRGEFFGELAAIDGQPRSANVTALHRSELCRMPGAVFNELVDGPAEFNRCLLKLLSSRIRSLNARLAEQAFLQVKYRLFAELIRLSAPRPGGGDTRSISPPPFHHDIASRIGTRREVVSRELSALEKAGLIDKTRGALVLRDPGELNRRISAALEEPAN